MDKSVIHAEWIGKYVKVTKAKNPSLAGLEGIIIDETRNMIIIESRKGVRRVPKHGNVFNIEGKEVQGEEVLVAPEERIKLKVSEPPRITRR